jgi:hypothetical protein
LLIIVDPVNAKQVEPITENHYHEARLEPRYEWRGMFLNHMIECHLLIMVKRNSIKSRLAVSSLLHLIGILQDGHNISMS